MITMNMIIAKNVDDLLNEKGIGMEQLADYIGMGIGRMRELMDGGVMITPKMQIKIAEFFGVEPLELTKTNDFHSNDNIIHAMMGRVDTEEAKNAIEQADEISNYILFYRDLVSAGYNMEKAWM